jgi:hypothetical protein
MPRPEQTLKALLLLYREVLGVVVPWLADLVRAKQSQRLPVGLTLRRCGRSSRTSTGPRLMAVLLYGAGLRLLECYRLRMKDVEIARTSSRSATARAARTA